MKPQFSIFLGAGGGFWSLTADGVHTLDAPSSLDSLLEAEREKMEQAALAMLNPWHIRRLTWWERVREWLCGAVSMGTRK